MSRQIVFNIYQGNFADGFNVRVSIQGEGSDEVSFVGNLPPNADLHGYQQRWSETYRRLPVIKRMTMAEDDIVSVTVIDVDVVTEQLRMQMNAWFSESQFVNIRNFIIENTSLSEPLRFSIRPHVQSDACLMQEDIDLLLRLPWHIWNLFSTVRLANPGGSRLNTEIILEAQAFGTARPILRHPKILAIIGFAPDLDTGEERRIINRLRWLGAEVKWLECPSVQVLNDQLWRKKWDIIFFAGHSNSSQQAREGLIQLNQQETLPLTRITDGLNQAARNGLKLAILNSCDGINSAENLIDSGVPYAIIARDLLPNEIAVKFLGYFIEEFILGTPLSQSLKQAKTRLKILEDRHPCASWLSTLFQRSGAPDLVWKMPWWVVLWRNISWWVRDNKIISALTLFFLTVALIIGIGLQIPKSTGICGFEVAESYLSCGERPLTLLDGKHPSDLDNAFKAIEEKQSDDEIMRLFENAWKEQIEIKKDDQDTRSYASNAQTLIYRNNWRAKQNAQKTSTPVYVIAAAVPLKTSPGAAQEMLQGIAQAQDKAVQDRLNLQILIADEDGDGDGVVQVAKNISSRKKVLAVIGHRKSEDAEKVLPTYKENDLVLISGTSTDSSLRSKEGNGIFFRTVATTQTEAKTLLDHIKTIIDASPKIAVFYSRTTYGTAMKDDFSQAGVTVSSYLLENFRLDTLSKETKTEGSQAIAIFPEAGENEDSAKKAIDLVVENNGVLPVLGGTSTFGGRLISRLNASQQKLENPNFAIAIPWISSNPDCKSSLFENPKYEFDTQACKNWGGGLSWRSATSYDATQVAISTLDKLIKLGKATTRQSFLDQLRSKDFLVRGVNGEEFSFGDGFGERKEAPMFIVKVRLRCDRTGFEYVLSDEPPCP